MSTVPHHITEPTDIMLVVIIIICYKEYLIRNDVKYIL